MSDYPRDAVIERRTWLWSLRQPGPMVTMSLVYMTLATVIMTWQHIEVTPDYILLLLMPLALAIGRLGHFLRDWIPFVALFLGYEAMKGIPTHLGLTAHVTDIATAESTLFLGRYPTAVLQGLTPVGPVRNVAAFIATAVYLCHFILPFAAAFVLWQLDHIQFRRFMTALLGMSFTAFLFFLLVPTAPPLYAQSVGAACCMSDLMGGVIPTYWSPIYNSLDANAFAAFPSLHAAYPFLVYLAMRPVSRLGARIALGWAVLVWVVVVYLGQHYVVDVLGGVALATAAYALVARLIRPTAAPTELATLAA